jgi:hypothetical protein
MRKAVLVSLTLAGIVFAADESVREVVYLTMTYPGRVPIFDKGYMFKINTAPQSGPAADSFGVWDTEGRWMYQAYFTTPDGTPASVHSPAADTDNTVIASIGYGVRGGYKGGIAFLDPTGKQIRFVNTDRYHPMALCFAPDHSIWAAGWQRSPKGDVEDPSGYSVVHKFSSDGTLAGEFLLRSEFPPGLPPAGSGISWIRAADDRVGMMLYPGQTSENPEWVEMDFSGNLIGRWKLGRTGQNGGFAFTADARLFARSYNAETKKDQLLSFDRNSSSWQAVDGGVKGLLLGADRNDLVFQMSERNANGVRTVRVAVK